MSPREKGEHGALHAPRTRANLWRAEKMNIFLANFAQSSRGDGYSFLQQTADKNKGTIFSAPTSALLAALRSDFGGDKIGKNEDLFN